LVYEIPAGHLRQRSADSTTRFSGQLVARLTALSPQKLLEKSRHRQVTIGIHWFNIVIIFISSRAQSGLGEAPSKAELRARVGLGKAEFKVGMKTGNPGKLSYKVLSLRHQRCINTLRPHMDSPIRI
jgi:hypothetical protein